MFCVSLTFFLTCLLCVTIPANIRAQGGCFLQEINLEPCCDQNLNTISEACCEALNQALEIGFYCLCLLLPSFTTIPILNFPSVLPLSNNCYISVPSVAQCQAPIPGLYTPASPVPLPPSPAIPKQLQQPTFSTTLPLSSNLTSENSAAAITGPPYPSSKEAPNHSLSNTGNVTSDCDNKIKNQLQHYVLFLIIALVANCIF